jgi:hypothetical protein
MCLTKSDADHLVRVILISMSKCSSLPRESVYPPSNVISGSRQCVKEVLSGQTSTKRKKRKKDFCGKVRVLKMETKIKQSLEQRRQGTVPVLSALGDWSWSLLTHAHIHCCPASLDCLVASVSIVLPEGRAIAPAAPFSSRPRRYGDR